jgi:hypothetical protein
MRGWTRVSLLLATVLAGTIALLTVVLVDYQRYRVRLSAAQDRVVMLQTELDGVQQRTERLVGALGLYESGPPATVTHLVQDLLLHRELIPYEGILGGTMSFRERDIAILNSRWAAAYFEDGHYCGRMLLRYSMDDSGAVAWHVLDSYTY